MIFRTTAITNVFFSNISAILVFVEASLTFRESNKPIRLRLEREFSMRLGRTAIKIALSIFPGTARFRGI